MTRPLEVVELGGVEVSTVTSPLLAVLVARIGEAAELIAWPDTGDPEREGNALLTKTWRLFPIVANGDAAADAGTELVPPTWAEAETTGALLIPLTTVWKVPLLVVAIGVAYVDTCCVGIATGEPTM